ncbi:MAG: hypothetical protein KDH19_14415, partial [Geminicoccaceae bacterium]|nr:hypothetical protein [Geminicoccaceae bacterium]
LNGDTGITISADTDLAGVHISGTADVVTGTAGAANLSYVVTPTATGTAAAAAEATVDFTYTDQAGDTFTASITLSAADKGSYDGSIVFEGTGVSLSLDNFNAGATATATTDSDLTV